MDGLALATGAVLFAAVLFLIAAFAESRRDIARRHALRGPAYALSLAVYCSTWTIFGAVGSAASDGWSYLPIYLGPILVFLFGRRLLERLIVAVHQEGATTISDFIGSHFGKSRGVAALVTITATLGIIPYIALQLRSIGTSFVWLNGAGSPVLPMGASAVVLGAFALLFGTRRYETAGRNEGLVYATAVESLVKLGAIVTVAAAALPLLAGLPRPQLAAALARFGDHFSPARIDLEVLVITLLSMAAVVVLPRQFFLGVIEARGPADLRRARWPFILYLTAMSVVVLPITLAGMALLPGSVPADLFVLQLPLALGREWLAVLAFLGGFSAATAMVVVESIALATMISNDLFVPLVLRRVRLDGEGERDLGRLILIVRRGSILLVILAAFLWGLGVPSGQRLASIGLIAFAAMAQFAPLLLRAVYRTGGDAPAAKAGLLAGLLLWLYTLALPPVLPPGLMAWLDGSPLDPHGLFGTGGAGALVHGVSWSMGGNLLAFALVAARRVGAPKPRAAGPARLGGRLADLGALAAFAGRFVGPERAAELVVGRSPERPVERADARRAERLIAGVVGAPSARALIASALAGERLSLDDVTRMLDESAQSLQFSKGLLAATLENIDTGVSVVDGDQRLVAWNSRYLELFDYPPGMVHVGAPIAALIRFNARRGELGPGSVDDHVERRLGHLRRGLPHSFERVRADGRVIKTVGGPMPGGGYVMCFTDATAEARARAALEHARSELETRVAERTAELTRLNEELSAATRDKTRFLAAASHDLLQPLQAARLFAAALEREQGAHPHLLRIERSIAAADTLLRALLDISKLDSGGITPRLETVALRAFLADVVDGFRPLALEKGLALRLGAGSASVVTDPTLLRSIVQNYLSNAIRYTERGGVIVGIRRRGGALAVEVTDTGPGIAADQQALIFREFERLSNVSEGGVGLGLAIVERTARVLGGRITLRSVPGRGSTFGLRLPAAPLQRPAPPPGPGRRGAARHARLSPEAPAQA